MSFALTTNQVIARTKTVTRRTGWADLKPGTLIRAVKKGMGLRKGEKIEPLAILCVVDVRQECLQFMSPRDVVLEGFPTMSRAEFVGMFCRSHKGCMPGTTVTRIEFRYVPGGRLQ